MHGQGGAASLHCCGLPGIIERSAPSHTSPSFFFAPGQIEATKATLKTVDKSDGRDNSLRDHDMDGFEDSGMRMGGMRSNRRDYARAK